jgi:hypothetical protein
MLLLRLPVPVRLQRWLYPVDKSRPVLGVDMDEVEESDGASGTTESKKDR